MDNAATTRQSHLGWFIAAAALGWALTAFFSAGMDLPRDPFLPPYILGIGLFLYFYFRTHRFDWTTLRSRPLLSVILALIGIAFMVFSVHRQPSSARPQGFALAFDIVWSGIAYGATDAIFMSIFPVLAIYRWLGHTVGDVRRSMTGLLAIVASVVITATTHLGYTEYTASNAISPIIGNTIMTILYIVSANPLVAIVVHVAMHIAAVLHGAATTMQLPPH